MMAETMIERVQKANLLVLKEVDRICRKHRIQYLLDSGTLLGAIRHKGFIPWDDDVDIAFMRKDYERFIEVAPREFVKGIHIWFPEECRGGKVFYDFTPKLIYENSRKQIPDEETAFYGEELNHLCIDIFILDEISENHISCSLQILLMRVLYGMAMGHRRQLDYGKYRGFQRLQVMLLAKIGACIPMPVIYRWEKKAAVRHNGKKSRLLYYSDYQPDYIQMTVPREGSEQVLRTPFEGESFLIPKGWERVLFIVYGDYMTLPPIEMRKPKHGDLENEGFFVDTEL